MSKEFVPFEQERVMSKWENVVDYNLGDSGVHPMTTEELVGDPDFIEEMLSTGLYHPQANGILELREHIANLYPGATPDNVLVTSGAAQANFTTLWTLLNPGDEIVVMLPNYLQIWGIAHNSVFLVISEQKHIMFVFIKGIIKSNKNILFSGSFGQSFFKSIIKLEFST